MEKRILLVHNYYQIGGGEHTVFENEKNLLLENNHEVFVYSRSNDELKSSKWKLFILPFTTIWSFKTYRDVRKLICDNDIEIVHCHNTFPLISPSVYYAARSLKVPVIQTIHNFRFLCPNGLFYCDGKPCEKCREQESFAPALKNSCYRNSKIQTAVAAAMLKIHRWLGTYKKINYIFLTDFNRNKFNGLIDIHGDNVFIKPNFVPKVVVGDSNAEIKTKFIYAGRLDENKGICFLLEAWSELPKEYELHIYGDGGCRKACEEAAQKFSNVYFWGFQPQQVVFENIAESAALVFPSKCYETFGLIWAESFSAGRPVVSADLGNHGDIIRTSGGGTLFEMENVKSFCDAVDRVVKENRKYSAAAKQYYIDHLAPEKNYEILRDIYDKAKHIQ